MHGYEVAKRLRFKWFGWFAATLLSLSLIGCVTTYKPAYQIRTIQQQSKYQPQPRWIYPSYALLQQVPTTAGLNGVEKPRELPSFVPDREPAYASGITLLSSGDIVSISPLHYVYEPKKFVFATYHRERITRVRLICFDGLNGSIKWSQDISAEGVYDITEIGDTLLFSAKAFNKYGKFVETKMVALGQSSGKIQWSRSFNQPFRYFSISQAHRIIFFSTKVDEADNSVETVEAVNVTTGKTLWSAGFALTAEEESSKRNAWPAIVADNILLFEDGVALRRLRDGAVIWSRKDIEMTGLAQPVVFNKMCWLPSSKGIVALDLTGGNIRWVSEPMAGELMKIMLTGNNLYAALSQNGSRSSSWRLALIDLHTGKLRWQIETEPLMGNIVDNQQYLYFTTAKDLSVFNLSDGAIRAKLKLPWQDAFSHHVITLRDATITVKNEWNLAMWHTENHNLVYHHPFEPLCPIMTTQDRMLEQRKLGAAVSSTTVNAASYNYYINTAYFSSQFNQAMSNYRSTGDSSYLSSAQASYGMTRYTMAQNRALAGMQFGLAMSQATMQIGTAVIKNKVHVTSSMIYPQIDAVMKKQRIFDDGTYVVRLVGVQVGQQRFAAVEIVHEPSGESQKLLLSPSQMPENLTTFARSPLKAQELNGYYTAAMYLGHSYSFAVDLKHGCLFHYGPGLKVEEYVTYSNTDFLRGRLWRFDIGLPGEKK